MKKIVLLLGPSGSGKTTVQKELELLGCKPLDSYTSRLPRYEGEEGHIFVSREEILEMPEKVAFTDFGGNLYCATKQQVDDCDVYVIDVGGVKMLKKNYKGERSFLVVGLQLSETDRLNRMKQRGDEENYANYRIEHDRKAFLGYQQECDIIFHTRKFSAKEIAAKINASR